MLLVDVGKKGSQVTALNYCESGSEPACGITGPLLGKGSPHQRIKSDRTRYTANDPMGRRMVQFYPVPVVVQVSNVFVY